MAATGRRQMASTKVPGAPTDVNRLVAAHGLGRARSPAAQRIPVDTVGVASPAGPTGAALARGLPLPSVYTPPLRSHYRCLAAMGSGCTRCAAVSAHHRGRRGEQLGHQPAAHLFLVTRPPSLACTMGASAWRWWNWRARALTKPMAPVSSVARGKAGTFAGTALNATHSSSRRRPRRS